MTATHYHPKPPRSATLAEIIAAAPSIVVISPGPVLSVRCAGQLLSLRPADPQALWDWVNFAAEDWLGALQSLGLELPAERPEPTRTLTLSDLDL